jgi:hypothetical protein
MKVEAIVNAIKAGHFMPSKPIREVRPIDLQRDPEVISSRKHNGNSATLVVNEGNLDFYTASNIHLATIDSKHWITDPEWVNTIKNLPNNTILRGEVYIPNTAIEDLGKFQEWYTWHMNKLEGTKATPPQPATFRAFEVLAWEGQSVAQLKYKERFAMIPSGIRVEQAPYTKLSQAKEAAEHAKEIGIEGYVFWDANATSLCKLTGQTIPRGAAWKAKPIYYENYQLRSLVNADPVKLLVMLASPTYEFKCGSGLTQAERAQLVADFSAGKQVSVLVAHYGIDETGKPEVPAMQRYVTLQPEVPLLKSSDIVI